MAEKTQSDRVQPDNKTNFAVLGIIAIVGIVAIVALFGNAGRAGKSSVVAVPSAGSGDLAGQAYGYDPCSYYYEYAKSVCAGTGNAYACQYAIEEWRRCDSSKHY